MFVLALLPFFVFGTIAVFFVAGAACFNCCFLLMILIRFSTTVATVFVVDVATVVVAAALFVVVAVAVLR